MAWISGLCMTEGGSEQGWFKSRPPSLRIKIMSIEKEQVRFSVRGRKGSYHKMGLDP